MLLPNNPFIRRQVHKVCFCCQQFRLHRPDIWNLCLDENVRLTTISVKKGFQYSSFLQIVILRNDFCSIVNSLMVVKKVIRTLTNLQLKASGLIIQSNYLRWRLHLLTTNVNNLNVSNQYFEDMPYFCEKQMWTGFVKAQREFIYAKFIMKKVLESIK